MNTTINTTDYCSGPLAALMTAPHEGRRAAIADAIQRAVAHYDENAIMSFRGRFDERAWFGVRYAADVVTKRSPALFTIDLRSGGFIDAERASDNKTELTFEVDVNELPSGAASSARERQIYVHVCAAIALEFCDRTTNSLSDPMISPYDGVF